MKIILALALATAAITGVAHQAMACAVGVDCLECDPGTGAGCG